MVLEEEGAAGTEGPADEDTSPAKSKEEAEPSDREGKQGASKVDTGGGEAETRRTNSDRARKAVDREKDAEADREAEGAPEKARATKDEDVVATPAVRGLARELGVEINDVTGSGEKGRVLEEDVRKAAKTEARHDKGGGETGPAATERIKLRSIRRSTAKRMARAWREIPHVTHHDAVDITDIERMRREHAGKVEENGDKLTLTPFLLKALAGALHEHPRFNAWFDADSEEIELVRAVNIGVAMDTEHGLLVPVLNDVQRKTVLELAVELGKIAERLREGRADRALLSGGTITLTNVGSIGGTGFSPIINPPQVAIFGAARAELRQVVVGGIDRATAQTRLVLPVCIAFDHRVNNGADAARFMNTIKLILSDPQEFALRS